MLAELGLISLFYYIKDDSIKYVINLYILRILKIIFLNAD
ncbi:hypothetical protein ACINIS123_2090 [Acinetobacter baumannii IS-123]|nr:hypothetical protein ACINIS123_2090 [Acinetobacter baumannii IS-123]